MNGRATLTELLLTDLTTATVQPQLPLTLLTAAQGHPILVELKSGETYNGQLVTCDTFMNIILREAICTSKNGDRFWRMHECYVRGNTVKYLRITDEILDIVQKEQQKRQQEHSMRGGRGGAAAGGGPGRGGGAAGGKGNRDGGRDRDGARGGGRGGYRGGGRGGGGGGRGRPSGHDSD